MANENKQTGKTPQGASYAPNEKFADWDKSSSSKQSNRSGLRKKKTQDKQFAKDGKNRINPAEANFVSEGNPNTDHTIKKAQESGNFSVEQRPGSWNNPYSSDQASTSEEWPTGQSNQTDDSIADNQLTKDIEAAIEKEDSLAEDDKSDVHVTVENGFVTLEGTVFSEQQKRTIGDKAVAFAGNGKVNNQLLVIEDIAEL